MYTVVRVVTRIPFPFKTSRLLASDANERFVGTTTAVYFLINLAKIPAYWDQDLLNAEVWWRDLPLFPIVLAGVALGVYLNRRVPGAWFSRLILLFVLVTGIWLLVK